MGKRDFECTPWGNPTYNIFGWQRPATPAGRVREELPELMEETEWSRMPQERQRAADCMVHCDSSRARSRAFESLGRWARPSPACEAAMIEARSPISWIGRRLSRIRDAPPHDGSELVDSSTTAAPRTSSCWTRALPAGCAFHWRRSPTSPSPARTPPQVQEIWERRQGPWSLGRPRRTESGPSGPILVLVALGRSCARSGRPWMTPAGGSIRGARRQRRGHARSGMGKDPELVLAEWQPGCW